MVVRDGSIRCNGRSEQGKDMVRSKGYCGIGRVGVGRGVWQSLSLATDKVERILNIIESLSKAIYDKK